MTVDLLRRAATLMRERAEAASTPEALTPWGDRNLRPVALSQWPDEIRGYLGGPMGEHCASWHPTVALAVADWLDTEARILDMPARLRDYHTSPLAVAVARAYLGES